MKQIHINHISDIIYIYDFIISLFNEFHILTDLLLIIFLIVLHLIFLQISLVLQVSIQQFIQQVILALFQFGQ